MIKDIDGNNIEVGDLILIPKNSSLTKSYVLGYSKNGKLIVSCERSYKTSGKWKYNSHTQKSEYVEGKDLDKPVGGIMWESYRDITKHNAKQNLTYHGDLLILKKNCEIPEQLKQFIKL